MTEQTTMTTTTMTVNELSRRSNRRRRAGVVTAAAATVLAVLLGTAGVARGQEDDNKDAAAAAAKPQQATSAPAPIDGAGKVDLMVNRSTVVTTRLPYKTVNVANPDVVDFNRVDDYQLLLTAKKPGATQLMVWDVGGGSQAIDVNVTTDLDGLKAQLKEILPGNEIQVSSVNGVIALRGRVPSLKHADQAAKIARPFGPDVLNFLEVSGGQQVMLKVRFAEVSRTAGLNLGFRGFATDGQGFAGGTVNGPGADPIGNFATGQEATISPAVSVFGAGNVGSTSFEFFVEALRKNNLLRVLAEPNLMAYSGENANFLAGGEFPVPVPQSGGAGGGGTAITVEYKQFGVQLNFTPVVLGNGRVRMVVAPEVSDLDYSRSISLAGFVIPTITKRNVSTTVELAEGQTFAIGGLFNTRVSATKDATPLLGDLPVLGALFRSVRYERSETELVVLVTPYIVEGMNPAQVPALPGENWRFPTEGELFWDRDLGGEGADEARAPRAREAMATGSDAPKFRGQFGFTPAE